MAWIRENEIQYDTHANEIQQEEAKTAKRRVFKPKIDHKLCKKCMICVVACPDNAIEISSSGNPMVNYTLCKGCLVCLRECPHGAITEEKE